MLQITTKDPAIRLFGQKIPLPGDPDLLPSVSGDNLHKPEQEQDEEDDNYADDDEGLELDEFHKDPGSENVTEKDQEEEPPPSKTGETKNSSTSSPDAIANPKTPSIEEEASKSKSDKSEKEQQQGEAGGNSQDQKTLKKPDKLLPCPRCNSMDTKFCYYNNYNVNQPRYFCKACQRYWTAGGTMRNVPVGAGRRKNKSSASAARHITISEALQAARIDAPNGSRVLSFGLDHQKPLNGTTRNGFEEQQRFPTIHSKSEENGDDSSTSIGKSGGNGFIIPSVPWPYAALCPSGFPLPFYPPAFWNWNVNPWFSSASNPNSPTLGKHSRDGDMIKHDSMEKEEPPKQRNGCVLVPKTLRIDDPNEAAKSSIWATLGIKKESAVSGGGMFKAFQSNKEEKKNHHVEASPMLMANPAALSRSLNFHENS